MSEEMGERRKMVKALIDSIGLRNGEITIKIQHGNFVGIEISGKIRNDEEGIEILENVKF